MSNRFAGGLPSTGGRGNRKPAIVPQPPALMLEKLPSLNLELSQVIHRDAAIVEQGYTKVMLRGVPRFLIDAFDRIQKDSKTMVGLFRKEGSAARMKNSEDVYYYKESVNAPGNHWTINDVCSLVKRFLRDLKTPLVTPEIKTRLFEYAKKYPDGVIEPHKLTILFEPSFSDKGIVHPMPPEHIGTLGFIMRQLNDLSKDAALHEMDVNNLAIVFAPTIFRDCATTVEAPHKTPKAVHGKQTLAMQKSLEENELRIAAMVVLIKNSQWIGVPSNFYLASGKESAASSAAAAVSSSSHALCSRSNSLRPSASMYDAAAIAALPITNYSKADKGGSVSARKLEKRHSVKSTIASRGREADKEKKERRRSNSTVRDLFNKVSDRVRRKSAERKHSRHPSPVLSVGSRGKGAGGSSRGRSPAKKMLLDVDEHTVSALPAPLGHYEELKNAVATGRPSLKSSSFLQPSKSPKLHGRNLHLQPPAPSPGSATVQQSKQRPARPPPPTPTAPTTKIERVASGGKKRGSPCEGRESRRRISAAAAIAPTTQPLPRRSLASVRDEPKSFLGEEFMNVNHKFPVNRVRRHTAPIKTGLALRRNQPNTVHSGLKGPMRRALTIAAADDKENARSLIRVIARRRKEEMEDEDGVFDEDDDTLTDTNRTMTGIAVVYPPEDILEMNHIESRARRAKKCRRSGGEGGSRDSASSLKSAFSPLKDTASAPPILSKSPAPPPLPQCSPPNSSEEEISRPSHRRATGRAEEMEDVEMQVPPLSAPPIPCPRLSLGGSKSPHFAIPSLPVGRASSVSTAAVFATPKTSRRPMATTLGAKTPVANSPLGRRGSSASALDSPQFKVPSASFSSRRQMSVGEKDFAFSEMNKAALLESTADTDLDMNSKMGMRPSVAMLKNQNKGMVAARVNLFAAIQSTSDAENASMRVSLDGMQSSLGSSRQSLNGLDEAVRGGPPVGHSIMSSGGSSSGSSSKRSSIASHR